jgi:putative transposase
LRRPELLITDGGTGLESAIAAVWDRVPVQRCTVHKHRNLLAYAPERLHEEITADYLQRYDLRGNARGDRNAPQNLHPQVAAQAPTASRKPETGSSPLPALPPSQWCSARTTNAIERLHEEFKRRIKTQTVLPSADTAAMLFWALLASGRINMRKVDGWQTLATKLVDQPIDLSA